jgi:hypothetical protein
MHALVRFAQAANTFSTGELHPHVAAALGCTIEQYSLASLRYDLSKLRAKGLVEKLPRSRRYRLPAEGYSLCLIFLKLVDRIYEPDRRPAEPDLCRCRPPGRQAITTRSPLPEPRQ